jgi:hypothetical protein
MSRLIGRDLIKKVEFVFNTNTFALSLQLFFRLIQVLFSIGLFIIFPHSVHDPSQFLTFGIQENTLRQSMYVKNVLQFRTMK